MLRTVVRVQGRSATLFGDPLEDSDYGHNSESVRDHGKLHLNEGLSFRQGVSFPLHVVDSLWKLLEVRLVSREQNV